jgi:hypothetical protein
MRIELYAQSLTAKVHEKLHHCDISGVKVIFREKRNPDKWAWPGTINDSVVIIPSAVSVEAIKTELALIMDPEESGVDFYGDAFDALAEQIFYSLGTRLKTMNTLCVMCTYHSYVGEEGNLVLECIHPDDHVIWGWNCAAWTPMFGSDHWQFEKHEGQEPDHG